MATRTWRGDRSAVPQVDKFTPGGGGLDVGDIFTLTMNGRSVNFTATTATVANVTAGLTAAWNSSTVPEHTTLTAADQTTYMQLTADTAGTPFTVTSSATQGGGGDDQTLTRAVVTASASPNDWDDALNWSSDDTPDASDDVVFENSDSDCLFNLDQNALLLTSLTIKASYTGKIGLPRENAAGYVEYLDTYLYFNNSSGTATTTVVQIGQGTGAGSGRIKLKFGDDKAVINVYKTGTRATTGIPCVLLGGGSDAANALTVNRGDVGVAIYADETMTLTTLDVGYMTNRSSDATVQCGSGLTLTTLTQSGGVIEILNDVVTVALSNGEFTIGEDATCTTLNIYGGTCFYQSTGTCGTANVYSGAVLDFQRDARARTITQLNVYEGSSVYDPQQTAVITGNGFDAVGCGLEDVVFVAGKHRTWTPSAI